MVARVTRTCDVAWRAQILSAYTGTYRFHLKADDNVRMWVNQEQIIDKWWNPARHSYGDVLLTGTRLNDVRIEYRDR